MWTYIYVSASILATVLFGNKILKFAKLTKIFLDTVISRKFKPQIHLINDLVNNKSVIRYGPFTFNSITTHQQYDIMCFSSLYFDTLNSNSYNTEFHNYVITNEITEKIPITLIRNAGKVCTIPFRASDYGYQTLYVAIKHLCVDEYSVYKYENDTYINVLDLFSKYENKLHTKHEETVTLAEAYD